MAEYLRSQANISTDQALRPALPRAVIIRLREREREREAHFISPFSYCLISFSMASPYGLMPLLLTCMPVLEALLNPIVDA